MKLDTRHLHVMLVVTAGAIAYNVWFYVRPAPRPQSNQPVLAGIRSTARPAGGPAGQVAVDPATIPAPPTVDLVTLPTWGRNPFVSTARPGSPEARIVETGAPVVADPVVRSILYSPQRRMAIVDGKIVGVGDQVSLGRVVAIEQEAVVIETGSGERRRFALKGRSPSGGVQ